MKAKEYFEKYDKLLLDENEKNIEYTTKLLLELSDEITEIQKQRKTVRNESFVAIIKEINQKWNAICNLYKKKYGMSPLIDDGFKIFWINRLPELERYL